MQRAGSYGFSLIELMVVVAIVGILAATVVPAYLDYARTARQAKVLDTYDTAARSIRQEYLRVRSKRAMGFATPVPESDADWIAFLNPHEANAPGGGPALVSGGGDSGTGAIGVTATGDFEAGTAQVLLTRPIYENFDAPLSTAIVASGVY